MRRAGEVGAGLFCLVRTSNPGAAELQDAAGGGDAAARAPRPPRRTSSGAGVVEGSGLSGVGAVVGATRPELLVRLRELMPRAIFLLPGVGAQGGRVEDLEPAFGPSAAGGLVAASRSIVDAHRERGGSQAAAAAAAAEELRASTYAVSERAR